VTYSVRGRTKVKENVCDFSGEVRIKKIYHVFERDADSPDYYKIIADYSLKEDSTQNGKVNYKTKVIIDWTTLYRGNDYVLDCSKGQCRCD